MKNYSISNVHTAVLTRMDDTRLSYITANCYTKHKLHNSQISSVIHYVTIPPKDSEEQLQVHVLKAKLKFFKSIIHSSSTRQGGEH